ncbi:RNA-dependent RNA polymerase [Botrytis cinerea ourmia-like virus 11]|uniref:RNA-dependent RNA polymerase n=1 Tax=Botrytis cinerea ourmia-like virus 11 TaxID=2735945 RepID=A0ABX6NZ60_9VIRU|nr:RNA-dependent RNA polymerase [Botrytis cinerea ourmia-like virus 11]QJT73677.1 RNA-dependent RNA polymerase [Botrytis cinerea ourmia-like virus 11]
MTFHKKKSDSPFVTRGAPCPAGGSIVKALNNVIEIVSREFSLTNDSFILLENDDCVTIRARWDELCVINASRCKNRKQKRLKMMLKGCNRLFDRPCSRCDVTLAEKARNAWDKRVDTDVSEGNDICRDNCALLKKHVRGLAEGWGKRLDRCRKDERPPTMPSDIYVPDQQGCLENTKGTGGTLAVGIGSESRDLSLVRRGVAKQKGKFRVVTMQSAYVKRVLRPVHNALYDHLTSFGWCVRGDVTKEDFLAVLDSTNEGLVSGDYESATDLIYQPAVEAICDVICEDADLTDEEREVLRGSFRNLRWLSKSGTQHPIKRGSMMGNLVSFPFLCLLNKACHDIASDEIYGEGERRVGRFNGDDCLFGASGAMYRKWRAVTARYGLVVNEKKTMFSRHWADLNSQTFDCGKRSLISKPVLSFLRPSSDLPGEILSCVISGIRSFKKSVQLWIVSCLMRYEISLRGFTLSSLPSSWCKVLVKHKWFRSVCWRDATGTVERIRKSSSFEGVLGDVLESNLLPRADRKFPTTLGPPPKPFALETVHQLCSSLARAHTDSWLGVRVIPVSPKLDRRKHREEFQRRACIPQTRFTGVSVRWSFLWPSALLQIVEDQFPQILSDDKDTLVEKTWYDSPFLTLEHRFRVTRVKPTFPIPFTPLSPRDPRWSPFQPLLQYA